MNVQGSAWVSSEDSDEYWAEGVKCEVEVELTDVDEVRIGIVLNGEESESAGLYLSRQAADKLARYLSAASVSDLRVPSAS